MGLARSMAFGLILIGAAVTTAASNIDPDHRFTWSENVGWLNWQHDTPNPNDGLTVGTTFLNGFVWAENIGWISFGNGIPTDGVHYANINGADFGVNINPVTGDLFGLAWGENVGWIKFDTAIVGDDRVHFDECDHRLVGYAWGENIGWINLNDSIHFVAIGPCDAGDLDCSGEVTLDDFAGFTSSLSGPDATTSCSAFDVDDDNDVDLVDFAGMQRVITVAP